MTAIRRNPARKFIEANRGRVRAPRIHQEHQRIGQRRHVDQNAMAANMGQNAGGRGRSSPTGIHRNVRFRSVLEPRTRHTRCLASGRGASLLMIWPSATVCRSPVTLVVSTMLSVRITTKERGLQRDDLCVSIQARGFRKGTAARL